MVNKRGWIRIAEATIAVLMIFAAIIVLVNTRSSVSEDLSPIGNPILEEIANNYTLRERIVQYGTGTGDDETLRILNDFARDRISRGDLNYSIKICPVSVICSLDDPSLEEVYSSERILSVGVGGAGSSTPKKLKIFIWKAG